MDQSTMSRTIAGRIMRFSLDLATMGAIPVAVIGFRPLARQGENGVLMAVGLEGLTGDELKAFLRRALQGVDNLVEVSDKDLGLT